MALILLFNAKDIEKEKLKILASRENVELKYISMKDLDQKMGYLAEIEGFENNHTESDYIKDYDFTFAFFKDLDQKDLFNFIEKMRSNDVVIDHKASITPTNINWTLRYLLKENHDEHLTMQVVNEINTYLKKAREIKEKTGVENKEITKLVKDLNNYFQTAGKDFNIEVARDYKDKIKNLTENL